MRLGAREVSTSTPHVVHVIIVHVAHVIVHVAHVVVHVAHVVHGTSSARALGNIWGGVQSPIIGILRAGINESQAAMIWILLRPRTLLSLKGITASSETRSTHLLRSRARWRRSICVVTLFAACWMRRRSLRTIRCRSRALASSIITRRLDSR
jgi:hypothetical protein